MGTEHERVQDGENLNKSSFLFFINNEFKIKNQFSKQKQSLASSCVNREVDCILDVCIVFHQLYIKKVVGIPIEMPYKHANTETEIGVCMTIFIYSNRKQIDGRLMAS